MRVVGGLAASCVRRPMFEFGFSEIPGDVAISGWEIELYQDQMIGLNSDDQSELFVCVDSWSVCSAVWNSQPGTVTDVMTVQVTMQERKS